MSDHPSNSSQDQRRYVRTNTIFPVDVRIINTYSGQAIMHTLQMVTRDISEGGMCLQISSPTAEIIQAFANTKDHHIELAVSPLFAKRAIHATAQVMWNRLFTEQGLEKMLVGIRYRSILPNDRKRLFQHAKSLQRRPYLIVGLILILLATAAWFIYHYHESTLSNQVLNANIEHLTGQSKQSVAAVQQLKQEKLALQGELHVHKTQQKQLQEEVVQISKTLDDSVLEQTLLQLQEDKRFLNKHVIKLNAEISQLRKQLTEEQDKHLYLNIHGLTPELPLEEQQSVHLISLHNQNLIVAKRVEHEDHFIRIQQRDGTQSTLLPNDVQSIVTFSVSRRLPSETSSETQRTTQNSKLFITEHPVRSDFLKKIQFDSFKYFLNEVQDTTGLVLDTNEDGAPANISCCGLALTLYPLAAQRSWLPYDQAYNKCLLLLQTLLNKAAHEHGFFYRLLDPQTGQRAWNSEAASLDTAVLVCGALLAGSYFENSEVSQLAQKIANRVEWPWMTNGTEHIAMGYKPEIGFLPYYWSSFNESLLVNILASGSQSHPLAPQYWQNWKRPRGQYANFEMVYAESGSLLAYQLPHIWVDFRNIQDRGLNYWENSKTATLANQQFCVDNSLHHRSYGPHSWGLSTCIGPDGFQGYGAKPGAAYHDGTVCPSAVAASVPFAPDLCFQTLHAMLQEHREKIYGFYGFRDAFNLDRSWYASLYTGFNQGLTVLAIENHLSQFVWKYFMSVAEVRNWQERCLQASFESSS